jgi:hypothetical protein
MEATRNTSLPKVRVAEDGRTFRTDADRPFVPFGVNYYRPGTGWAPQVWKQFDADATRRDFDQLRELGGNCVRVFLTFGSFYQEPGALAPEGVEKFDRFLELADAAGIYVHPTGPDHWEGVPEWMRTDHFADEDILQALEAFWTLLAGRCRGRPTIFAYDLLNEPTVRWDGGFMARRWNRWLAENYHTPEQAARAWGVSRETMAWGNVPVPPAEDKPSDPHLLDYQRCRETVADEWTRRQAEAIKAADPDALVTVGLIQWAIPANLPSVRHYAAFRPERIAPWLDFLEVHFYPLDRGAYEYRSDEESDRNLAYLESVVREVAAPGKPVVIAEFGWYGGGSFTQGNWTSRPAGEEEQAEWCTRVVETTAGMACGWLNWGFHDHPGARDVSQLTGLLTATGDVKAWGRRFRTLAERYAPGVPPPPALVGRPDLDWDLCVTSSQAGHRFREEYYRAFRASRP